MKLYFDTHGNDKQKLAATYWADGVTGDIVYGGSKGSGKSYLGVNLTFGDAFIYPDTHYFIAREALNDLRKFTLPSIYEVFGVWGISKSYYKYNGQDNLFNLYNGSVVYLLEAKYYPSDPLYERFGSMQMTRGWIEEAGQVSEDAKNNLAASIGRWKNDEYGLKGKLLQTCNPSKNYLYKTYKAHKEGRLPEWSRFIQALPTDNKKLDSGYLDHLSKTLSLNQKRRLLYGDWEYDDDPSTLCDYEKIIELFTNDFSNLSGDKFITADVARFGSDKIVIGLWNGWRVRPFVFTKQAITESYRFIEKLRTDNNIPLGNVIADEDGVGGGLVDMMRCKGFVNNSKAIGGENYDNLQAQCAFKLSERINSNGIFFDCGDLKIQEELTEELEQLKQKDIDADGKKGIVGKDVVKSLIGRSPDYRDMLLMRMWFELKGNKPPGPFDYTFGGV
jgi:phage terminase large subunit